MNMVDILLKMTIDWLVVTGTCFIVPYIGNVIIPTHRLIFFRGVGEISPTRQSIGEHGGSD